MEGALIQTLLTVEGACFRLRENNSLPSSSSSISCNNCITIFQVNQNTQDLLK